jgi:DNA-binding transcriptional regulator GbsR (MarR family)
MNQSWVRLPLALLSEYELKESSIIIYAIMLDRSQKGLVKISIDNLMKCTGLSRRTIFYSLDELEAAELIQDKIKDGRATTYIINEILPPKQKFTKKKVSEPSYNIEDYKQFINDFD